MVKTLTLLTSLSILVTQMGCVSPSVTAVRPTPNPTSLPEQTTPANPAPLVHVFDETFEDASLPGWENPNRAGLSTAAHQGQYSAELRQDQRVEKVIRTQPGQVYKLTAWIEITAEEGDDWGGFQIDARDTDWNSLGGTGPLTLDDLGQGWIKIAFRFTPKTEVTRLSIGYFGGPAVTQEALVDDLQVFIPGENRLPEVSAALTPGELTNLPGSIDFNLSGDDPDGAIQQVVWDFGDGTRSFDWSGSHPAVANGDYAATLTVVDDDLGQRTFSFPWAVNDPNYPSLSLDDLPDQVDQPNLSLSGTSQGDIGQVIVSTDRGVVQPAQGTQRWQADIALLPGWNRVLVQAQDSQGHLATQEKLVRYVPAGPLQITPPVAAQAVIEQWGVFSAQFQVLNSAATQTDLPYSDALPPGLANVDGISVDVLFTPDDWVTTYRRPAFYTDQYEFGDKGGEEWSYPQSQPAWWVRFSPPGAGEWTYRIEVSEARGSVQSPEYTFTVTAPSNPTNHGPIRVSSADPRYFEFADGSTFPGAGINIGLSAERFSLDAEDLFHTVGQGNEDFFRTWLGGNLWGSAWQPWVSMTLGYAGYLPQQGFTLDADYANNLAAFHLDLDNPILFQGWNTGHASTVPGQTYRLVIRWRSQGIQGPSVAGYPHGMTVKFADWPTPGQTLDLPALIAPTAADTPWHVDSADFTSQGDHLPGLALMLENATAGSVDIDEIAIYAVLSDGHLGPQILRSSRANAHLSIEPIRAAGLDRILQEANDQGFYFKLVISEKDEYLLNHLGPFGLPVPDGYQFFNLEGTPGYWLHNAYWRYLSARYGAYRSVQSWELVNETEPAAGDAFQMTTDLAAYAAADGNPHLASTSTWATLAEDVWKDPEYTTISYVDFHAYADLNGNPDLANDTAAFYQETTSPVIDAGFGKPVIWGEAGVRDAQNTSIEDARLVEDRQGIWLHKFLWAQAGPSGVYTLQWYTDSILANDLHSVFGTWRRFMEEFPLSQGGYQDAAAQSSDANLEAIGQKNLERRSAYLWIDNRLDTWTARLQGQTAPALNGTLTLNLAAPQQVYRVTWVDPYSGEVIREESLTGDSRGSLKLTVSGLSTDIAVRIDPGQ